MSVPHVQPWIAPTRYRTSNFDATDSELVVRAVAGHRSCHSVSLSWVPGPCVTRHLSHTSASRCWRVPTCNADSGRCDVGQESVVGRAYVALREHGGVAEAVGGWRRWTTVVMLVRSSWDEDEIAIARRQGGLGLGCVCEEGTAERFQSRRVLHQHIPMSISRTGRRIVFLRGMNIGLTNMQDR
jgi:hypothetical protein